MNRTRITIALAASLLVAQIATAQMMGGGGNHNGSTPSNPSNPSGSNGNHMGGDMNGGMGQALAVGADGTVYTLRTVAGTSTQNLEAEVVALRPTGTIAWATKVGAGSSRLELSGDLVLVASGGGEMGMNGSNDTVVDDAGRLTALSAASGSIQWQLDLDGHVATLEPFSGGVYLLIVRHDGTNTGGGMQNGPDGTSSMKRSVAAVDNTGQVLWSIDLN